MQRSANREQYREEQRSQVVAHGMITIGIGSAKKVEALRLKKLLAWRPLPYNSMPERVCLQTTFGKPYILQS